MESEFARHTPVRGRAELKPGLPRGKDAILPLLREARDRQGQRRLEMQRQWKNRPCGSREMAGIQGLCEKPSASGWGSQ